MELRHLRHFAAIALLASVPMVCSSADTAGYWEGKGRASEVPMRDHFRQLTRSADFEFWFQLDQLGHASGQIDLVYQSELTVENLPSVSAGGVSFNPRVGGRITDLNPRRSFHLAGTLIGDQLTLEIATPEAARGQIEFTIRADPGVSAGFGGVTAGGGGAGSQVILFPIMPFSPFNGAALVQRRPGGPYAATFDAQGNNWAIAWTARQVGSERETRATSPGWHLPPGTQRLAGGQVNVDCAKCATDYAESRGLRTDPKTNGGGAGVFDANERNLNKPAHYVVRNNNDVGITDPSILYNIKRYNQERLPQILEQYRDADTFTPALHEELMRYFRQYAPELPKRREGP